MFSISLGEDFPLTRWTYSEVGGLDTDAFVAPALITYPTFDTDGDSERMIPAFVYRPSAPGPHPVVVLMSGSGPQDRDESLAPTSAIKPFALIADALTLG